MKTRAERHVVSGQAVARTALLVVVLLVGALEPLASVVLGSAPRALAAPATPPRAPAPYGSQPLQPDQLAAALPVTSWHGSGLKSQPAASATSSAPAANGPARTPGEQPDLRTANSTTVLNADGTLTLTSYGAPVHYQDAQGRWQDIDNTIIADASDAGYAFGNKANSWQVHFAARSSSIGQPLVHAQFPGVSVSATLNGASAVSAATSGSRIVYTGILPQTDLHYVVGNATLEELLLLHSASAPGSYSFTYHVPGVTASQDLSGAIVFADAKTGAPLLAIGGITMYEADAQGNMPGNPTGTDNVSVTLSGKAPDFTVTLTPDHAWLTNPSRHFPVAIDPTWTGSGAECGACGPNTNSDTFVEKGHPTWNFWNTNTERIGQCNNIPNTATGYGTDINRSFIKFALAGRPAGARVTGAHVSLYQLSSYAGATQINANIINANWNSQTVTWNAQPGPLTFSGSGNASTTFNVWININITSAAASWWEGGQQIDGVQLQYNDETKGCDLFASDDRGDSTIPHISIDYVLDQLTPNTSSVAINGGATITNNPVVTLSETAGDPGATTTWSSNWTTVNGVGADGTTYPAATYSVDPAGSTLTAASDSCGATVCYAETFFTNTVANMNAWPTYTAMFKTDSLYQFYFGVISGDNNNTRFDVAVNATTDQGFTIAQVSHGAGSYSTVGVNMPLSVNTWYYGQVDFPSATVGEIYVWPVGQAKPATPNFVASEIYMTHPGLNFWTHGDNGANLHHLSVGNVTISTGGPTGSSAGTGVSQVAISNNNSTWSCPAPASGIWCIEAQRQPGWTLSAGDGTKTVYAQFRDNVGNSATASANILLDTTAPTVSLTAPAAGRDVRGWVTVSGTASDATTGVNTITFYVDGVQKGTATGTTSPAFGWDTTTVYPGWHVLTLQATDFAGNTTTSAPVAVAVSNGGQMPYVTFAKRTLPDGRTSVGVDTANGNAIVEHTDLDVPGLGPELALTRTYNNQMPTNNLFGYGWTSDLDERVLVNGDNSVSYFDPSGGVHLFRPNGSGGYLAPPGLFVTLVKNADATFTLTGHSQSVTRFNAAGFLTSIADRHGNTLAVAYASPTTLTPTTVTDAATRQLTITMSGGHVTHISGPGGISYAYAYDANGNLTDFTDQADSVGFAVTTHYAYDSNHWLTAIWLNYSNGGTNTAGMDPVSNNVETTLAYNATAGDANFSRLLSFTDPLGYDVDMNYDCLNLVSCPLNSGELNSMLVQQLQTNSTTTTPTTATAMYEATRYAMTTDGVGTLARIDLPAPDWTHLLTSTYTYDAGGTAGNGLLTQVARQVDQASPAHWHVNTYTYDANGNLTQRVIGTTAADGTTSYPANLNLTAAYSYDSANNLIKRVSPLGVVSVYVYDAPGSGDLIRTVAHCANQTVGGVTCPTVAAGSLDGSENTTTTHTYDTHGDVLTTTDPLGIVTLYQYDGNGNVVQMVKNCVNQAGCPTSTTADGTANTTTSAAYDQLSQQTFATDAMGVVTRTDYDIRGRVTQTVANCVNAAGCPASASTDPNTVNVTTTHAYDTLDRATSVNVPLDLNKAQHTVTATVYDADGRVIKTIQNYVSGGPTDTSTNVTSTTAYDAPGNATLSTDPAGNQTYTTFDALNRPVDVKQQSGGVTPTVISERQTYYDGVSNVVKTVIDPSGKNLITTYTFDAANRKHTKTEPPANPGATDASGQSTVTTYTYDLDGNVTDTLVTNQAVTNPVGHTIVTYDALGRPHEKQENGGTNSDGTVQLLTTAYTYDADGRTQSMTDPNGQTTATRDQLGQVVTLSRPDGTDSTSYDKAGHTLQTSNGSGHTVYTYDNLWRVIKEEHYDANNALVSTTSHAYDAAGHELAPVTILANGKQSGPTYTYDALGRIQTMSDGDRSYTYDTNGSLSVMKVLNGTATAVEEDFGYDAGNRPTGLTDKIGPNGTQLHQYAYGYDAANNITSVADTTSGGTATSTYTYDNLNQLLTVSDGTGTTTFSYDANHNRTQMVATVGANTYTTSYNYDAQSDAELISKTDPAGKVTSYTYDAAGNLKSATYDPTPGANQVTSYTYDTQGRLTSVTQPDGTAITFTYDADGNRASKTVTTGGPTPTITTVRDVYQAGRIAYQTDGAGTTLATFSYDALGTPSSVQVGSDPATAPRYYYVYNAHDDVVALVDAGGNPVANYSYDAFGASAGSSESFANGWTNPYRFDGFHRVQYDNETGLYWMSVRAYDPVIGRFISRDPLNRSPLFNQVNQPYSYAGNSPLTHVDPSGQMRMAIDGLDGGDEPTSGSSVVQTTAGGSGCGGCNVATNGTPQVNATTAQAKPDPCNDTCHAARDKAGEVGARLLLYGALLAAVVVLITVALFASGVGAFLANALKVVVAFASIASAEALTLGSEFALAAFDNFTDGTVGGFAAEVGATVIGFLVATTAFSTWLLAISEDPLNFVLFLAVKSSGLFNTLVFGGMALDGLVRIENILAAGQAGTSTAGTGRFS